MSGRDDRAAHRLLAAPFRPGESPFRIKGVAYRGHVEYCERFLPGGHRAVLEALGDPAMDAFYEQPFLASVRYDVFPLAQAGVGCARVTGRPFLEFVRGRSRWQAEEDVKGVYRLVLRVASPELLSSRLPRFLAQYFDFGGVEISQSEKGRVLGVRTGIPAPLLEWYTAVSEPYLETVLEIAGAKNVHTVPHEPEVEGQAHGVDLMRLTLEVTWES